MRCFIQNSLIAACFSALPLTGWAGEAWWSKVDSSQLPSTDRPVEEVIDRYIDATLKERGLTPAPEADPSTLIRRVTLDLNCRIPTVAETRDYIQVDSPSQYQTLVDTLIASPAFDRYVAHEWNWLLMNGESSDLKKYLEKSIPEGKKWDDIFRDVVTGIADENKVGADQFLRKRVRDLDVVTNDISVRFFGVNVSCAMCHDHPYVEDWTMDTYYGMKAFFGRTFDNGGFVGEKDYGRVSYKNGNNEDVKADLRFLGGNVIKLPEEKALTDEEKKKEKEILEKFKKEKKAPPAAKDSLRAKLVKIGLEPGSEGEGYFARSLVNRTWNQYFGSGLVMPLDQMHGANPPSHPELLTWLAKDLIAHDFDLRRLVRGMVLSKAYRRSSIWNDKLRPHEKYFAVAQIRPLNPRQYGVTLKMATTDPEQFRPELKPDDVEKRIHGIENSGAGLARWFERPGETFNIAVDEALLMTNSKDVQSQLFSGGLVSRLDKLKTSEEKITLAYQATLSRPPSPEELEALTDYLDDRNDRPEQAVRQMLWTLLAGSEARFNY